MSGSLLKKLAGLTAILIGLWAVYLYRQVPHGRSPFAQASGSVEKILMMQGAQTVQLSKQGESWKVLLSTGVARPADETKMKTLLSSLKDFQIEEEISDRADRHAEYQVDEGGGTRIVFQDSKGRTLVEGIFGKQAPDFTHSYFRFPRQLSVYIPRGVLPGDLGKPEHNHWLSREQKPSAFKTK